MARKSSINSLPKPIRKQVDLWIVDGKVTIDQLYKYLQSQGLDAVPSRSAVGRYVADITKTTAALRESREIATAIMQELGPQIAEGEQGRALVQMMRTLIFRFLKPQIDNPEAQIDPKEVVNLTRALKDLSQAMRFEQDFEQRVRDEAIKAAREEAAVTVGKTGHEKGLSREMIATLQEQILGVKLPVADGEL